MTKDDARDFAFQWQAKWRKVDIDGVVEHFALDGEMRSPLAFDLTGSATIRGREEIRKYWRTTYGHLQNSDIDVETFSWDDDLHRLTVWWSTSDQRAVETMNFGSDGLIVKSEAFYGK